MNLDVNAAGVEASAATETGISAEMGAAATAAAAALTCVMPMRADPDSVQFAAALNAAGASYLGAAAEHLGNRGLFAVTQNVAAATYTATDVISNTALAL